MHGVFEQSALVDDWFSAPTWSRALATATVIALGQLGSSAASEHWAQGSGIYHLSAGGRITWLEFAADIFARGKAAGVISEQALELKATTGAAYGAPAPRPTNSVLSNEKIQARFGIYLPDWRASFEQMFNEHPASLVS